VDKGRGSLYNILASWAFPPETHPIPPHASPPPGGKAPFLLFGIAGHPIQTSLNFWFANCPLSKPRISRQSVGQQSQRERRRSPVRRRPHPGS